MRFARPELIYLVVLLPVLVAFAVHAYARRRRRVAEALGERHLLGRLGAGDLFAFPTLRLFLVCGAAAALGVAAAGPQWGTRERTGQSASLSAVLALDISKSMHATDVSPDRLERQRLLARRILREMPGDRFGMVVFAGRAYVLSPMTVDHSALHLYLDALDPEVVSQGGSSLAAAIAQATDLARGPTAMAGDRAVLLVSDGEALEQETNVIAAAQRAAEHGVVIHTVGVGTTRGSPIPERNPRTGEITGYKRDEAGEVVVSRLNEGLLRDVAGRTGGRYVRLDEAGATDRIIAALQGLERTAGPDGRRVELRERFGLFIALALMLLALDVVLARRGARDARARPVRVPPAPVANAALLVLYLGLSGFGVGDVERGNRLYREGRYAEAIEAYRAALRDGDDSPELQYNLGTALLRVGRYAEAERHLQQALTAVDPDLRHRSLYNLGNRYLQAARAQEDPSAQGRMLDAAVEAYKHALRLEPADADAKWNLEMALREQDDSQQQQPQQEGDEQQEQQQDDPDQGAGGGGAGSAGRTPADGTDDRSRSGQQEQMSQEQADRILSAVEQDERELTRSKLRKGQRRTPVLRDW